jgi:hypothetical protein
MKTRNWMQSNRLRWGVAQVITASLVALTIPATNAKAAILDDILIRPGVDDADYDRCARQLSQAKVATADIASACAQAVRPGDLGVCVDRITRVNVSGADALSVCRNVRRPVEAATCVVDIRRRAAETALVDVLDSCRRSLLPDRFSECVVELSRNLKLATKQAIDTCIDASDRATDLVPTTVPSGAPPTQVVPEPTTPGPATPAPTTPTTPTTPTPPTTTPAPTTPDSTTPAPSPGTVTPQRF